MFSKPYDPIIIFAVFTLVIITAGFGINSIKEKSVADINASFYDDAMTNARSTTGLKGTADDLSESFGGEPGSSEEPTEEGILVSGFKSILSVGKTMRTFESTISEGGAQLGINPLYWEIPIAVIIIITGVLIYTWLRT